MFNGRPSRYLNMAPSLSVPKWLRLDEKRLKEDLGKNVVEARQRIQQNR